MYKLNLLAKIKIYPIQYIAMLELDIGILSYQSIKQTRIEDKRRTSSKF